MRYRATCHKIEPMVCRISGASGDLLVFSGKCLAGPTEELHGVIASTAEALPPGLSGMVVPDCEDLLQDDILLVYPSGSIRLLYRSGWHSNAIFLTNQCNNHCICCPQPPGDDQEDLLEVAQKMVELIRDEHPVLGITGGEPTCVWDNLVSIVSFTKKRHPGAFLQLLTNGRTFADYDKTEVLAAACSGDLIACVPLFADVHHVHDALTEVEGSFWETMAGLKNLARVSLPVEIRIVVTRHNYNRLPQMARFIYRNLPFVTHVAFMGLELVGYAARNKQELWIPPAKYMPLLDEALHLLAQRDMPASIYNHPLCVVPERLHRYLQDSISEWKVDFPDACSGCSRLEDCPGLFPSVTRELVPELKPYRRDPQEAPLWHA